jgi:hypothetical protein
MKLGALWERGGMRDHHCPECAGEFEVVWRVTVDGALPGYTAAVDAGPREIATCISCRVSFERREGDDWQRQVQRPKK